MLQARGQGSTDEVTFTMKVAADVAGARAQMDGLRREYDQFRRDMERPIRMGFTGYGSGPVGSGPVGSGGARGGVPSYATDPRIAAVMRDAAELEKQGLTDMANRYRTVAGNVGASMSARWGAEQSAANGWRRRQAYTANYRRDNISMRMEGYNAFLGNNGSPYTPGSSSDGIGQAADSTQKFGQGLRNTIQGVEQLTRAIVYLGASSAESMEEAVRALAKYEAAVGLVKGGMSLGKGLGGMVGVSGGVAGGAALLAGAAGFGVGLGINRLTTGSTGLDNPHLWSDVGAFFSGNLHTPQVDHAQYANQYDMNRGFLADQVSYEQRQGRIRGFGLRSRIASELRTPGMNGANFAWSSAYGFTEEARGRAADPQGSVATRSQAEQDVLRGLEEQLRAVEEIGRREQEISARKLADQRQITAEYQQQAALAGGNLANAEARYQSGMAAYGSLKPNERGRFDDVYRRYQNGDALSERDIQLLAKVDPRAANMANQRRGMAAGYDASPAGQAALSARSMAGAAVNSANQLAAQSAADEAAIIKMSEAAQARLKPQIDSLIDAIVTQFARVETAVRDLEIENKRLANAANAHRNN